MIACFPEEIILSAVKPVSGETAFIVPFEMKIPPFNIFSFAFVLFTTIECIVESVYIVEILL